MRTKIILSVITSLLLFSCQSSNQQEEPSSLENFDSSSIQTSYSEKITEKQPIKEIENNITFRHIDISAYKNQTYRKISEIDIFKDIEGNNGAMIEPYQGNDYAIHYYKKDNRHLIIYEKIIRSDNPSVRYTMIDAIEITGLFKNQYINYANCRKNKQYDKNIIVVYHYDDNEPEFYTSIIKAWSANHELEKIIEIETNNIDCENEGYGI